MKAFKLLSLILTVVFLASALSACGNGNTNDPTPTPDEIIEATPTVTPTSTATEAATATPSATATATAAPTPTPTPLPDECTHNYTLDTTKANGDKRMLCAYCGNAYIEPNLDDSFKILSIGNSYSLNAIYYLQDIAKDCGAKDIVIGGLYIGGCSLTKHWETIQANGKYEKYRKYTTSLTYTESLNTYTLEKALKEEDWDIITIQQSSADSPFYYTYAMLSNIIRYVKQFCPETKIVWHMTWSYANSYDSSTFKKFDRDQVKMYNGIVESIKKMVLTNGYINGVIPVGTALQNVRSTHIGDTLNPNDGTHLAGNYGLYTAGLTWYAYLTGKDVMSLPLTPPSSADTKELNTLKTAVKNAIENPYEITK